jgi:hypothetical protein
MSQPGGAGKLFKFSMESPTSKNDFANRGTVDFGNGNTIASSGMTSGRRVYVAMTDDTSGSFTTLNKINVYNLPATVDTVWVAPYAWRYPSATCSGRLCFRPSPVPGLELVPAGGVSFPGVPSTGLMIFGTVGGRVILLDLNDNTGAQDSAVTSPAAAGSVSAMAFTLVDGKYLLFLSSESGIVTVWEFANRRILGIAVLDFVGRTFTVDPDSAKPVVYLGGGSNPSTTIAKVVRFNARTASTNFEVFGEASVSSTTDFKYLQTRTTSPRLVGWLDTPSGTPSLSLRTATTATCGQYSCGECGSVDADADYCGWCARNSTCTFSTGCSPADGWNSPPACPIITSMSPKEGAVTGGTLVTFVGTGFFADASRWRCNFPASAPFAPTSVSPTQITCNTPAGSGIVAAGLTYSGVAVSNVTDTSYEYYSCGTRDCSTCSSRPECTWCYRLGMCTSLSSCTSGANGASCPRVTSVSPSAAAFNSTTSVIQVSADGLAEDFAAGGSPTYYCGWQPFSPSRTLGTYVAPGKVSCATPQGVAANPSVTPQIYFGVSGPLFSAGLASSSASVDFYDCRSYAACFTCLAQHPECKFCPGSGCAFLSNGCTGSTSSSGCPQVRDITPSTLHVTDDASTSVSAFVSIALASLPNCVWTSPSNVDNAPVVATFRAINGTGTTIRCPVPSSLVAGTWTLTVFNGSAVLTNPGDVQVYDCSGNTCDSCLSFSRPKCGWCLNAPGCGLASSCSPSTRFLTPINSCPMMTVSKYQDTLAGNTRIDISLPAGQTLSTASPNQISTAVCRFSNSSRAILQTTTVSVGSGNLVSCNTPTVGTIGVVDLELVVSGVVYAPAVPFEYYDCVFASPGAKRDCESCTSGIYSGCSWCRGECNSASACSVTPLDTCPQLLSVSPNFTETAASKSIVITTSVPSIPADSYECLFDGGLSAPAAAAGNTIICETPLGSSAGAKSVRVGVSGVGDWAPSTSVSVEFISCPQGFEQCSSTCWFNSKQCGWCVNSAKCTGQRECELFESALAPPVWVNSTIGCPVLKSALPTHIQAARQDRPIYIEEISFEVDNLPALAVNNSAKRSIFPVSEFQCAFGSRRANVTRVEPTATGARFFCVAPTLFNQGFYTVQIEYRGRPVNAGGEEFQVQDCLNIKKCGLCILVPNCGWCPGATSCMTSAWCSRERFTTWGSECPTIRGPRPAAVAVSGGETVTISGGKFVDSTEFSVLIGGTQVANATRVDEGTITFLSLPNSAGSVSLAVLLNGTLYHDAADNLTLTFLEPNSIQGPPTAIIAGVVVPLAVIIAALVLALIIMKKRKVGFFAAFKLKEPDYNDVAFGVFLQPVYKFPKDNYDILAMKLLAKDPSFVFSVLATTAPTEQDAVAKSLTFFFEHRKRASEYLVLFISDEVKRNKTENTIFRNNSMASKMFKYYSKVVGVKYLFHTLARFIVELNGLSTMKKGDKETSGAQDPSRSLLSMEMEVDPTKYGEDAMVDSDANVLQLQFACQKVFTVIKASLKEVPSEFTQVFQSMREAIINKFQSEDAILKAVGGFLFLRFVCPALTAPHAYGLLPAPPSPSCQRQLVLIGKIIQNLANLTQPGAKVRIHNLVAYPVYLYSLSPRLPRKLSCCN